MKFDFIRRQFRHFQREVSIQDPYEVTFGKALIRSRQWGLQPVRFQPSQKRYVSDANTELLRRCLQDNFEKVHPQQISQQCFMVHAAMIGPLEEAIGVPLTYTIGYVTLNGRPVFHTPIRQLRSIMQSGMTSPALNLHAWLTLPSHEIIDLTFATTFGMLNNIPETIGLMSFLHPRDLKGGTKYHPQLVGDAYLYQIGAMLDVSVLTLE